MQEGVSRKRAILPSPAMVVAIMVTFIVFLLSLFVIQVSTHNSQQSAYDRKRIQSVDAAALKRATSESAR